MLIIPDFGGSQDGNQEAEAEYDIGTNAYESYRQQVDADCDEQESMWR